MSGGVDRLVEQMEVVRCQAGDAAAFATPVERYGPRLRYYLAKMLRDRHAADDIQQDVWLDVYRGIGRLAEPRASMTWLYRIARGRVGRRIEAALPDGVVDASAETPDFTAAAVHAGLDELPAESREVLVPHFLEDMSYGEIAAVVGRPAGTVASRLHLAKLALKRILGRIFCYWWSRTRPGAARPGRARRAGHRGRPGRRRGGPPAGPVLGPPLRRRHPLLAADVFGRADLDSRPRERRPAEAARVALRGGDPPDTYRALRVRASPG